MPVQVPELCKSELPIVTQPEQSPAEVPCNPLNQTPIECTGLPQLSDVSLLSSTIRLLECGRESSSQDISSDDAQEQLSDLQDKLEVSCQWAYDLESDLKTACALVRESDDRCRVLECALSERDLDLESAFPKCPAFSCTSSHSLVLFNCYVF
jgi:hypothetical protein